MVHEFLMAVCATKLVCLPPALIPLAGLTVATEVSKAWDSEPPPRWPRQEACQGRFAGGCAIWCRKGFFPDTAPKNGSCVCLCAWRGMQALGFDFWLTSFILTTCCSAMSQGQRIGRLKRNIPCSATRKGKIPNPLLWDCEILLHHAFAVRGQPAVCSHEQNKRHTNVP